MAEHKERYAVEYCAGNSYAVWDADGHLPAEFCSTYADPNGERAALIARALNFYEKMSVTSIGKANEEVKK